MSPPATARQISNAPEHSTAYYFIEGLNELGIEHLFCNFGTDHAPTMEALADRQKRGEKIPNVMLCPHENTAAHIQRVGLFCALHTCANAYNELLTGTGTPTRI